MNRITAFFLMMLVAMVAQAQNTFTQNLEKSNGKGAKVSVHQSSNITQLVNGTANNSAQQDATPATTKENKQVTTTPATTQKTTQSTTSDAHQQTANAQKTQASSVQQTTHTSANEETAVQEVDHSKKVMRNSYKTTGYRVQVYAGGNTRADRQKTERIGNQIKNLFPTEAVYTHFYSPRWICRMGNYRTYEEAHEMLEKVKKQGYKEAVIVKGKITVAY